MSTGQCNGWCKRGLAGNICDRSRKKMFIHVLSKLLKYTISDKGSFTSNIFDHAHVIVYVFLKKTDEQQIRKAIRFNKNTYNIM